jgi:cytochrome d ubiquinol oxidase subunit I
MEQGVVNAARVLMGDSLGFHIIFVLFGLTLPILVSWFEFLGLKRKDQRLIEIAKFWSKIMTILVITGVISGTIIALQMSLVWPGILKFGGEVIGLPFLFETYAFLIEAVFLSLYMATWNSKLFAGWRHWVLGLFVILGSTLSAYAITSVNGWMNLPSGFDYVNGQIININVAQAMFSQVALIEFFHSMPGYYIAAGLFIAGMYAIKLLRVKYKDRSKPEYKYDWMIIKYLMAFVAVFFVFSAITADITGKYLAKHEPEKLAAIELNYQTRDNAPLLIGGVAGPSETIKGPHFEIPGGLSFLAGNSTATVVVGLEEYDEDELPPLYVHTIFDIKMTIITFMVIFLISYFVVRKWFSQILQKSWALLAIASVSLFGIILVELGWMMTEIGRQPWAVSGYLTTSEAVTKTNDISTFGYLFPISYVVLLIVTILAVRKVIKIENKSKKKGKK